MPTIKKDEYIELSPVYLTHDQIIAIRDLVHKHMEPGLMKNDITAATAKGLLRLGSFETLKIRRERVAD